MITNEIRTLRMNLLGEMDTYIREAIGDDYVTDAWNILGIPDEASEADYIEIAEDDHEWARICVYFGNLIESLNIDEDEEDLD